MFSLFIFVTQDGWVGIFEDFKKKSQVFYIGGAIYCFVCILLGAFVFANLVVAVVVTNLELAMREIRSEQNADADMLSAEKDNTDKDNGEDKGMMGNDTLELIPDFVARDKFDFTQQKPLTLGTLHTAHLDSLATYFLVLNALEENLTEYKSIRTDLDKMLEVVMYTNFKPTDKDEEDPYMQYLKHGRKTSDAALIAEDNLTKGDILSNLMKIKADDMKLGISRQEKRRTSTKDLEAEIKEVARELMHIPSKGSTRMISARLLQRIGKEVAEIESEVHN